MSQVTREKETTLETGIAKGVAYVEKSQKTYRLLPKYNVEL
jgi:hypothetical protein